MLAQDFDVPTKILINFNTKLGSSICAVKIFRQLAITKNMSIDGEFLDGFDVLYWVLVYFSSP